jgi:Putative auto-transporter adhesin, head GIN domain
MLNNVKFRNNAFGITKAGKKLFGFLLVATFTNCSFAQRNQSGSGTVTAESRPVTSFNKIIAAGVFKVILKQTGTESVTVETDDNLQKLVLVEVSGETLTLTMKKNSNFRNSTKMNVYVTLKNITELNNSMVGNLSSDGVLKTDNFKYTSSAVGGCDISVDVTKLDLNISAVGKTEITGKATNCKFINSAVGSFEGSDLIVENMKLNNSAVGRTTVNAQNLDLKNSAVGKTINKNKTASKAVEEDN